MKLSEIHFPVYRLSKEKPLSEGSILYYRKLSYNIDTNEERETIKIIDDTSLGGESLGRRRLKIPSEVRFRINRTYAYIKDVIKQASNGYWFIDSAGNVFQYKRSIRAKLECREITKIHPGHNGLGSVIEVKGIPVRFKTLYIPTLAEKYAGILHMHGGYVLYGLYTEEFKETWRMV